MNSTDLDALFNNARNDGALSDQTLRSLDVADIGAQIQAALGTPVDQVAASEVVLVTLLMDDSSSIGSARNTQAVRDGHNLVLDALLASKQKENVLVHCRYLNGTVLYPYCPLGHAARMDAHNYNPTGSTPLYDQSIVTLATVVAKAQEFLDNGVAARTVSLIVTDGADYGSRRATPATVLALAADMQRTESHIIAGMGVEDGSTDFRRVFKDMGLRPEWILTPGSGQTEIRKAFQVFSQSAVRASQCGKAFSPSNAFFN